VKNFRLVRLVNRKWGSNPGSVGLDLILKKKREEGGTSRPPTSTGPGQPKTHIERIKLDRKRAQKTARGRHIKRKRHEDRAGRTRFHPSNVAPTSSAVAESTTCTKNKKKKNQQTTIGTHGKRKKKGKAGTSRCHHMGKGRHLPDFQRVRILGGRNYRRRTFYEAT